MAMRATLLLTLVAGQAQGLKSGNKEPDPGLNDWYKFMTGKPLFAEKKADMGYVPTDPNYRDVFPSTPGECQCIPWQVVYTKYGVKCGQGLEFYAWLGELHPRREDDPKLTELRYNLGKEFCEQFFERMHGAIGVRVKFNTPPSEKGKPWDKSWCYVRSDCAFQDLNGGDWLPDKPVKILLLNEPYMQRVAGGSVIHKLTDKDAAQLIKISKGEKVPGGLDLGILAGYSYYMAQGEDPDTVSEELINETLRSELRSVLQPLNHLAPRYLIEGNDVWKVEQNVGQQSDVAPGTWWTTKWIKDAPGSVGIQQEKADRYADEWKMAKRARLEQEEREERARLGLSEESE